MKSMPLNSQWMWIQKKLKQKIDFFIVTNLWVPIRKCHSFKSLLKAKNFSLPRNARHRKKGKTSKKGWKNEPEKGRKKDWEPWWCIRKETKTFDPRAKSNHGPPAWECDALPTRPLDHLNRSSIINMLTIGSDKQTTLTPCHSTTGSLGPLRLCRFSYLPKKFPTG